MRNIIQLLISLCVFAMCSSFSTPSPNIGNINKSGDATVAPTLKKTRKRKKKGPSQLPKKPRPRIPIIQYHDDWVCVSKASSMMVHKSRNTERTQLVLGTLLKRQLARKVFPVHRLDYRTSGAILFAFNSETCNCLHKALTFDGTSDENNVVSEDQDLPQESQKNYVALVRGDWTRKFDSSEVVTIDKSLNVKGKIKESKTEFRLIASSPGDETDPYSPAACSLVLCTPKTGRTHQIRRHAYAMGFPIIGDSEHGDSKVNRWWRENRSFNRLFLHCLSLDLPPLSTFDSSKSKERIECTAPLFPDLLEVLEHNELKDLWDTAKKNEPRLTLELVDEKGGTFGRNYRKSKEEPTRSDQ